MSRAKLITLGVARPAYSLAHDVSHHWLPVWVGVCCALVFGRDALAYPFGSKLCGLAGYFGPGSSPQFNHSSCFECGRSCTNTHWRCPLHVAPHGERRQSYEVPFVMAPGWQRAFWKHVGAALGIIISRGQGSHLVVLFRLVCVSACGASHFAEASSRGFTVADSGATLGMVSCAAAPGACCGWAVISLWSSFPGGVCGGHRSACRNAHKSCVPAALWKA